ncbi:toll/interleukin-1 receptor domain-containing protein [Streptomyces sulphureus]|uniref:toll/interleukin-1 receptor domain-containing protein n=1 Tax=Streptomyces sulphureus TaxID=47758 RepID=UPI000376AF46|nr:toll/interleukin-1 receptor domain-containing protein [Streptomyces sulphureus]
MPEVFVNYRTHDGDKTAAHLAEKLASRFGDDLVFRASSSIRPGAAYPAEILDSLRSCSVVVAVVGPRWLTYPDAAAPALAQEEDWVRRELLEALVRGIPIVPLLDGRTTPRLVRAELPADLADLADLQYLRWDTRTVETDAQRVGDELAARVPRLAHADAEAPQEPGKRDAAVDNTVGDVTGPVTQYGDLTGDSTHTSIGTVHGSAHTGSGDQNIDARQYRDGTHNAPGARSYSAGRMTNIEGGFHGDWWERPQGTTGERAGEAEDER